MQHASKIYNKPSRGFTLIELMIIVVILGVLSTIAYPSYIDFVKRGHETEAKGQIMDLASELEALRAKSFSYAGGSTALSQELDNNKHYSSTVNLGDNNQSYTITATPSSSRMSGMSKLVFSSKTGSNWD